jgi:cell division protease FtsH
VTILGGRAAEEVVFQRVTTGASNDLERATDLARKMVMEYGMSDELGAMTFGDREELVFLGRSIAEHRNYSEAVARRLDGEVRKIIGRAYQRSLDVMTRCRSMLDKLAEELIQRETLDEADVKALLAAAG